GDNFRSEITLSGLAKEFGYSVEHVSRVFHKYLKTGIPEYVNGLRLNCVEQLVKAHPEKKITEIIFDSGFNSIQSYYRNKARKNS
ncbi:MAG: helix-turn-helix domain-containing protein, partial [Clostridia bacterium]|nr:helix-turn-helix domain-containing protein [Clostridia bacterium]